MKKLLASLLIGAAVLSCGAVAASGGSSADPLITRSYLTGTYIPSVVAQAADRIEARTETVYGRAKRTLDQEHDRLMDQLRSQKKKKKKSHKDKDEAPVNMANLRYKQRDEITLPTGSGALCMAGRVTVSFFSGAFIDLTTGTTLASGSALVPMHHYLAAENTSAVLTVETETAVLSLDGPTFFSPSSATDYNALAAALKSMGLFSGTGTAYGSGFDLEKTPTRVEGLIMFLRLIGEDEDAVLYHGPIPFTDLPDWCRPYVGYAYSKGYTAGVGKDPKGNPLFAPQRPIGAGEYLTFVMRALGYRDSGPDPDFTWQTVLSRAREFGVITDGEFHLLTTSHFLRAHVAYLSYFSLDARLTSGQTLLGYLDRINAINGDRVREVRRHVTVERLP